MKQTSKYLLVIFIASLLSTVSFAQENEGIETGDQNEEQYVFWFYVKADVKKDRVTRKPSYSVRILSKKPKSGTLRDFDKDLWRNLNGGQNLVIGPFLDHIDAARAIKMYNLARHTDESMAAEIANFSDSTATNGEYYWFFLKYRVTKRKHRFVFEHTPARVTGGDIKTFKQVLWEGLKFKQLAIGPFAQTMEAEESKRRYRIEEN